MKRWLDAAHFYANHENGVVSELEYPKTSTLAEFLISESGKAALQLLAAAGHQIRLCDQVLGYSQRNRDYKRPLTLVLDGSGFRLVPALRGIACALYDSAQAERLTRARRVSPKIASCFLRKHGEYDQAALVSIYEELDDLWECAIVTQASLSSALTA